VSYLNRTAAVFVVLLQGLAAAPHLHAQSLPDRLDTILEQADLGGSVIVTRGGATLLSAGYGMANREHAVPNTPETKFRIGSITKQFTAMAILILQDRGKIHVEDRVGDHLTTVPDTWQELTIHQLLTHTSGIMHSWALPGFAETMSVPTTLDETLKRFFDQPLVFEPGTGFQYSGVGYFLLAKIIEEVSGKRYEDFLNEEIFTPLNMLDTGADRPDVVLEGRASGYGRNEDGIVQNAPAIFMPLLTGGGNLYSTVEDLARWDRALSAHTLISEEAYAAMYRPERERYGYGWRVGELDGRRSISHSGGVPGFNAFILRLPDQDICVVVLTNLQPGGAGRLGQTLAREVLKGEG
jgi:CubicO group peptidase (beta-lactamase class C family)